MMRLGPLGDCRGFARARMKIQPETSFAFGRETVAYVAVCDLKMAGSASAGARGIRGLAGPKADLADWLAGLVLQLRPSPVSQAE